MKTEENKLLEFQKRVGSILKETTNPFYKSKYFDINGLIESIKPILNELNLTLTQPLKVEGEKNILHTFLKDGETVIESSSIILPENIDPQKLGSAITYFRRYSIQSMLLLQAEDDDGSLGKRPEVSHKQQTAEPNAFKEMKEAKDLDTVKRIWTENKSLQHDSIFAGLKEKRKSELTPLKEHPLNVESEKITVDDILPDGIGEVEEVGTESFLKVAITELGKCKTVTGMNNKFREIRGLAAYMFLDDSEKNQITEFCKAHKNKLTNEKK